MKNATSISRLAIVQCLFLLSVAIFCGVPPCGAAERPVAHIYIDLASIPTLVQAVDVVSQPADEPKLIIWKRNLALPGNDELLQKINGIMINAAIFGEQNYAQFVRAVDDVVARFYKMYPTHSFQVHLNAWHAFRTDGHIPDIIPKEQIQEIHLYEDALGRSLWAPRDAEGQFERAESIAPTYFHMAFFDPERITIEPTRIRPINFAKMAQELSEEQRHQIAWLMRLDLPQIKALFQNRPVAVFVDDPVLAPEEADLFLKKMKLEHPEIESYNWLYKNHPRVRTPGETLAVLKKHFSKVSLLPNAIPLETLVLTGFTPDYVAGYGSSVFYSFKKDQVLGYIRRKMLETYENSLLDVGIIEPQQVFDVKAATEILQQQSEESSH